jgi:hypothetical protein
LPVRKAYAAAAARLAVRDEPATVRWAPPGGTATGSRAAASCGTTATAWTVTTSAHTRLKQTECGEQLLRT